MKTNLALTEQQQDLVEENLPLVWQTIFRSIKPNETVCGLSLDDLFQEGACALCHAAATYRMERGSPFSAYARPVIRNHLLDYCRHVQIQQGITTVPLDVPIYSGQPPPEQWLTEGADDIRDRTTALLVGELLAYGKRNYHGVALRGIEAMELKLYGYTGAEIARLYRTTPNNVGAWISRAVRKLRNDVLTAQPPEYVKEKQAAGF